MSGVIHDCTQDDAGLDVYECRQALNRYLHIHVYLSHQTNGGMASQYTHKHTHVYMDGWLDMLAGPTYVWTN
jgi:hypothetical protein